LIGVRVWITGTPGVAFFGCKMPEGFGSFRFVFMAIKEREEIQFAILEETRSVIED
jgi:hypothetical protein